NPYVNILVVRNGDQDKPWVKTLVDSYHSPEVKSFIEDKYHGTVLTSW
ncbi:MAG TPA: MetQ/NlpA family ABC transporter substrate-binding protein, partial [Paenirhodobacter sp.]